MKLIPLTRGYFAKIDDIDYYEVSQYKWWTTINRTKVYASAFVKGKQVSMHRFILGFPKGIVDHKDNDGLNNQKTNLRMDTNSQNCQNQNKRVTSKSKYKGVAYSKSWKRYSARILVEGVRIYLGCFKSELEAAKAYDAAARHYFGEFARTNF